MSIIGNAIEVDPISAHRILQVIYALGAPGTSYTTFTGGNGAGHNEILLTRESGICTFVEDVNCRIRLTAKAGYSGGSLYTCTSRLRHKDLTNTTSTLLTVTTSTNGAVSTIDDFIFKKGEQIWGDYKASKASVNCLVTLVVV